MFQTIFQSAFQEIVNINSTFTGKMAAILDLVAIFNSFES